MENLIVIVIVGAAAAWALYRIIQRIRSRDNPQNSECASCSSTLSCNDKTACSCQAPSPTTLTNPKEKPKV